MESPSSTPRDVAWLVYDGDCPVCRNYCIRARIRDAAGELRLVDARQPGPLMDEITAAGLDIDRGMVLKLGGQLYHGADAMHMLSVLSTRSDRFNRIGAALFGTRVGARLLYPAGRFVRDVLLKLLDIPPIDNLGTRAKRAAAGS